MEATKRPLVQEGAASEADEQTKTMRAEIILKEKSIAEQVAQGVAEEKLAPLRAECQELRRNFQEVLPIGGGVSSDIADTGDWPRVPQE